jgi:lipopolysaccharide/colanic/teichoic acid biosynthesis glycosyltransferase
MIKVVSLYMKEQLQSVVTSCIRVMISISITVTMSGNIIYNHPHYTVTTISRLSVYQLQSQPSNMSGNIIYNHPHYTVTTISRLSVYQFTVTTI